MKEKIKDTLVDLLLDGVKKKLDSVKENYKWQKLFVSTGNFFVNNPDVLMKFEDDLYSVFSKDNLTRIAKRLKDKNGYESFGTGPAFPIPNKYVEETIKTDLGIVMDKIFNGNGLKNEKGGIAHLTNDVITRYDLTREAFIMALTEFINGDLWRD